MALKLKTGRDDLPQVGDTIYVYYANSDIKVGGLTEPNGSGVSLPNPFNVPSDSDEYGFEPPSNDPVDVWWFEGGDYIVRDMNVSNPYSLDNPFPQYVLDGEETDPVFMAWDRSTGIEITLNQVEDWETYQEELVSGTNIKTINGESVLGEGSLTIYGDVLDESDPIFTAWDKSDGISIYESQISDFGDYHEPLISGVNIKTINGDSVLGYGNLVVDAEETDPIFTAWDKSTGITIYESQIIDLYPSEDIDLMVEEGDEDLSTLDGADDLNLSGQYQDRLINETNIKSLNGVSVLGVGNLTGDDFLFETDPVFTAWNKSDGITIYESQISDLGNYQEQLVSGTNIKTINGESILGTGDLVVNFDGLNETDPVFTAWDKSTGISITKSQVTDLGNYQDKLISGDNIKTINGEPLLGSTDLVLNLTTDNETDPVFTAWNKSDGITIYESQISDLGNYQESLVSGTNIKTINGESVLGSQPLYIYGDELTGIEVVTKINNYTGNTDWQSGNTNSDAHVGDIVATHIDVTDASWKLCDGAKLLVSEYPTISSGLRPEEPVGNTNEIYIWGANNLGQLGLGDTNNRMTPVQMGSLTDWEQANCGRDYSLATKTDGTLWAWGRNSFGQLGLGDITHRSSPVQVGSLTDWSNVSCGQTQTLAIKTDGTLWAWGGNNNGQLGLGDTTNYSLPVQVGSLTDWDQVSCGYYHSLAIKTDGTLWAWGANTAGQLGLGDTVNRSSPVQVGSLTDWKTVESGTTHVLAIKTNNSLWAWGGNYVGQLGLGDTINRSSPVQVGSLTNWNKIAVGQYHSLGIKLDGELNTWGGNNYGQLGLGDVADRTTPTKTSNFLGWKDIHSTFNNSSFATRKLGTLWTWGYGYSGISAISQLSSPVQVGSLSHWNKIAYGYSHGVGITNGSIEEVFLPNLPSIDNEKWYIKVTN